MGSGNIRRRKTYIKEWFNRGLENKKAIITGAGGGFGREIALKFAK